MHHSLGTIHSLTKYHIAELTRQAEQERLANLAKGPGRPLRSQSADRLIALAEWLDETPRPTVARAG